MLDRLKTYLLYGNRFCGVEHTLKDDKVILYATLLKKSNKKLDVESAFKADSVESLAKKLPKRQAISLVFNNDNVLTKQIEGKDQSSEKLVFKAFPNIHIDDFYYEILTQGSTHFVAICRKAYIQELIVTYETNGLYVINISLGNLIASSVARFVNSKILFSSNSSIQLENMLLRSIEKTDIKTTSKYYINGLEINNYHLLSLSAGLDAVIKNYWSQSNINDLKNSLKSNYNQSRFFTQFLKIGLGVILAMLLINFSVFNHYFNKVNALQQTSQINQTTKQKLLKLNESVSKSQKMVDDVLKSSSSKSSFYTNTVIQGLPNSILLSELNYQPLQKRIKKDKPIVLNNNTIILSGESNRSESFSKWLVDLESMEWINNVEILTYENTSKTVSSFSLKLNMNHDQ